MSSLMRPHIFLSVTAGILILLWSAMLLYSVSHFAKIRRETGPIERKCLCHEFWKMFLLHVGIETAVLSVILVLYYYTHKINFAETYNCTVIIASVTICRDVYRQEFNFLFIGGMAVILFLCIVTLCQAMCNEENFIEQFLHSKTTENEAGKEWLENIIPNLWNKLGFTLKTLWQYRQGHSQYEANRGTGLRWNFMFSFLFLFIFFFFVCSK